MACDKADAGITIELPRHDVEISPISSDIRMRKRNYMHAQFEVSEAAGKLLSEEHTSYTQSRINMQGEPAKRMVMLDDAVTFNRSLDGKTVANVELQDARKVLLNGTVEKSFKDVDAQEIIEYLLGQYEDPYIVIDGYNFINPGDADITATTSWFFESEAGADTDELNVDIDPFGLGTAIVDTLGFIDAESAGAYTFDFNGETVLEAMQEVMDDFGLSWWVDIDGILQIGPDGGSGQAVAKASGDNNIALARYTVTQDTKTTNAVQINVPVVNINDARAYSSMNVHATQAIAESKAPELDGSLHIVSPDRSFASLSQLERVATRTLFREVMEDMSGSMVINGLASSDKEAIRNLDVGDYFVVDNGVEGDCNEDVITGLFMVTSVHHKASPRNGWEITIEVAAIPNPKNLVTNSVLYDATEDKEYESFDAYKGSGGDDLNVGSP